MDVTGKLSLAVGPLKSHGAVEVMPSLERRWTQEQALLWVRWAAIAAWLILVPFIPIASTTIMLAVAFTIVLSNGVVWWLLRGPPSTMNLQRGQVAATVVEWLGATGVVAACRDELALIIPATYFVLILICGIRYRWPGVIVTTCVAMLLTGLSFLEHGLLGRIEAGDAVRWTVVWGVLIGFMGVVTSIPIRLGDVARVRRAAELAGYRREQRGLTAREWEVLELLVGKRLTYRMIADRLSISPSTVRTHVQHLGGKLGVAQTRRAVEQRARELDLFPNEDELNA